MSYSQQNFGAQIPKPINETVRSYLPGSSEQASLKAKLHELASKQIEIPLLIAGKEIRTGITRTVVMPHSHGEVLATFHLASEKELKMAADSALKAKADWENLAPHARAAIFLKAADLLAGPWRDTLNAATMLGQSKNLYQAEIDSACELIDFLRFNAHFYENIVREQPISSPGIWNQTEYRALEGFVLAITPFNFTAIAANLPASAAMMGNTCVWKPSDTQMFSAYFISRLFEEAGLPPGVINRVAADGPLTSQVLVTHPDLAGVHFTGSTQTFQTIWRTVGENISSYRTYPRLVGETGGKDFVFAHSSADIDVVTTALIRGAFEYQGQKCSAASRAYIPASIWTRIKSNLKEQTESLKMGDVRDFSHFINAVIDERSYNKITHAITEFKSSAQLLAGGTFSKEKGYFIRPTIFETNDAKHKIMTEEFFGPLLGVYVYEDQKYLETLDLCNATSPYALTGAILSQDRAMIEIAKHRLRHAAGNFYINDKPTGAVVGQQPFGGARASGTNDKAGSALNLLRWTSARTIKETFVPPKHYSYPCFGENKS